MATLAAERRRNGNGGPPVSATRPLRVAIYCRVSTTEGLSQEFNSLDNQQAMCAAFVASQVGAGWQAIPARYHDGGFTGANIDRPALKRLLAEVEAGHVDVVLTYRLDRLSRSMSDFIRMVELFGRHDVAFASVSESFNTATPVGRMTMHVILSFAQFEREVTAERTRDKVRAARRRGKWTGGITPLGYRLESGRLVPDEPEAHQVREMFAAYLRLGSLIDTASWANEKGWRTKVTGTHDGGTRGGVAWSKSSIHRTLSSPLYCGRIVVENEAYASEAPAIVEEAVWQAVQTQLAANGGPHTRGERCRSDALLAGLIFCSCGAAMSPSCAVKKAPGGGQKRYAYYRCSRQVKHGRAACPAPHVSAPRIEAEVVAEIAEAVRNEPGLIPEIVTAARTQLASQRKSLAGERRALERALRDGPREGHRARLNAINSEVASLAGVEVDQGDVTETVASWDGLWASLLPRERRRVVEMLVVRVVVSLDDAPLSITLHPSFPHE